MLIAEMVPGARGALELHPYLPTSTYVSKVSRLFILYLNPTDGTSRFFLLLGFSFKRP